MATTRSGRLPLVTKLIFGSADLFGGGASNMIAFFYLIFLTDVLRISPALAGIIFLASKAWDAVSDPLMGALTDRTRSRFGQHRPYFLAAVFSIFVSIILLWLPVGFSSEIARFLYAFFAYLFFSTVSTAAMIPYFSMQPKLTGDYHERISLNVFKMTFSFAAGILVALVPMQIVAAFDDIRTGYLVMSVVFGAVFALPWLGLFLHLREDEPVDRPMSKISVAEFIGPLRIRSFRLLVGIYLCSFLTLDIMSSLISYYMIYVLGRPGELSFVLGTLIVCQILFLPLISLLARRLEKARTLILCAIVWIASVVFIALSPANWPRFVVYIQAAVTGFGVGGCVLLPWTMYPDATDVGRFAFERECAGSFSGIMTFFRKLASALALFLVGTILGAAGYLTPADAASTTGELIRQVQPASALAAIRILLVAAPFLLLFGAVIIALRYPLSEANLRKLTSAIAGELDTQETEELRKLLV